MKKEIHNNNGNNNNNKNNLLHSGYHFFTLALYLEMFTLQNCVYGFMFVHISCEI